MKLTNSVDINHLSHRPAADTTPIALRIIRLGNLNRVGILRRNAKQIELQKETERGKREQNNDMRAEPKLIFGLGFRFLLRFDRTGLFERLFHILALFYLFDFGAQFVRHSYRILTRVWSSCCERSS